MFFCVENFDGDLIFGKEQEKVTFMVAGEGPVNRLVEFA